MSPLSVTRRNSSNRGFTLLEILLAMAIFAVIATSLYVTLASVLRGRERAEAALEADREAAAVAVVLRRELAGALYAKPPSGSVDPQAKPRFYFIAEDRDLFGKPAANLYFTTTGLAAEGSVPSSDQREVRYKVVEKEGKLILARAEKDLYLATEPNFYPQAEEIDGFQVECLDNGKWVKSWNTEINLKLPQAVRVTVTLKRDGKPYPLTVTATPRVPL